MVLAKAAAAATAVIAAATAVIAAATVIAAAASGNSTDAALTPILIAENIQQLLQFTYAHAIEH